MSNRRKKTKQKTHIYVVLLAVAALLTLAVLTERRPNTDTVDLKAYFEPESGTLAVVRDHVLSQESMLLENGQVYLPVAYLTQKLNTRFYYDPYEQVLLYTLPDGVATADVNSRYKQQPVLLLRQDAVYVLLPYAAQYTKMNWTFYEEPARLVLTTDFSDRQEIRVGERVPVREGAGTEHPIMTFLEAGSTAVKLDEGSGWVYICTDDGIHGYVARDKVISVVTVTPESSYEAPEYPVVSQDRNVCLGWHLVDSAEDNNELEALTSVAMGATVIAPTWFRIINPAGGITSFASEDYVIRAHEKGLKVWPLVSLDAGLDSSAVTAMLAAGQTRRALTEALVAAVLEVGADGINVDLENLASDAGPAFVQFIRELCLAAHAQGLVVSVDNYVPSAWTAFYDRAEQGVFCDYVVIMGYDEHYLGSDAGSTASISFVRKGIEDTLKEVPASRVINAVPFYSRLWLGLGDSLSSTALYMKDVDDYRERYRLSPIWDESLGQNYAEFSMDGRLARLWIEDGESMQLRLDAVSGYNLAGIAVWRLGMETEEVWSLIRQYLSE